MTRLAITGWARTGDKAAAIDRPFPLARDPQARTRAVLEDAVRTALHMGGIGLTSDDESAPRTQVIGITAPHGQEGKTTIAAAVSGTLVKHEGRGVVLVDADTHTNAIAREYGLAGHLGLTDFLAGETSLAGVTCASPSRRLSIIPAGTQPMPPVSYAQLSALIAQLRASHDYVIVDLPGALRSTTAPPLARLCDGVMVVVRSGATTTLDLDRALQRLRDAHVLGVIVNRWRTRIPRFVEQALDLGM